MAEDEEHQSLKIRVGCIPALILNFLNIKIIMLAATQKISNVKNSVAARPQRGKHFTINGAIVSNS